MKTRIAHFIDSSDTGGAEFIVIDLCNYLKAQGFEPIVLHFNNAYLMTQCKKYGIKQKVVPGWRYFKSIKTLPIFALIFQHFLRKEKIKLLHSHLYGSIAGGALAAFFARVPHIGTLHDIYTIEERPKRIRLLQLVSFLRTKLITVSKHMENFYKNNAQFQKNTFQTIYNGIELNQAPRSESLRNSLAILPNDKVIICVGRLIKIKQVHLFVKACSKITAKRKDVKILIVGGGPEINDIRTTIPEEQSENFKMLGERNDVKALLAASDIFVQFSTTEGLSMSILEAMASTLPCVVSDVGGNAELIKNNYNGFLVKPCDVRALAKKIAFLLEEPALRTQMSENSKQIIKSTFLRTTNYGAYMCLYKKMLCDLQKVLIFKHKTLI